MELAVGGEYEAVGNAQIEVLTSLGLADGMSVVDIGCGSGRTACKIAARFPNVQYLGIDVVEALLAYAASKCPPHFRFVKAPGLTVPSGDASADMVLAFSVFTHLTHEESYLYLEDAIRVLKPNGLIVLSFLEMAIHAHRQVFQHGISACRAHVRPGPLNMFIERPALEAWASELGVKCSFVGMDIGQSLAVLYKSAPQAGAPAADKPLGETAIEVANKAASAVRAFPVQTGAAVAPVTSRRNDDVLLRVANRYAAYLEAPVATRISNYDDLFTGDKNTYFAIGRSAIGLIAQAMIAAKQDQIRSILDFPCGGGRVTRHLVRFLPEAEVFACDLDKQKESFVVGEFDAKPFTGSVNFVLPPTRQFDLVFVGSLLTHLRPSNFARATKYFIDALTQGGLLVITTHGRRSIYHYKIREKISFRSTMKKFDKEGFGFFKNQEEHADGITMSYGTAFTAPSWLMRLLETDRSTRIVAFHEAAWADNQDAIVLQKRAIELDQV